MKRSRIENILKIILFMYVVTLSNELIAKEKKAKKNLIREPEKVSLDWSELPKTFQPTSPTSFVEWIDNINSSTPQIDNFSSAAEISARDESIKARVEEKGLVGIVIDTGLTEDGIYSCELNYIPNDEALSFKLREGNYTEFKYGSRSSDGYKKQILESTFTDKGNSVAQNAYGATVQLSRLSYKDISLPSKDSFAAGTISVEAAEARRIVPNLKCFVLFLPEPPFLVRQWDTKAGTLYDPQQVSTEDILLFGKIEGVWLIDSMSRRVLSKQH